MLQFQKMDYLLNKESLTMTLKKMATLIEDSVAAPCEMMATNPLSFYLFICVIFYIAKEDHSWNH